MGILLGLAQELGSGLFELDPRQFRAMGADDVTSSERAAQRDAIAKLVLQTAGKFFDQAALPVVQLRSLCARIQEDVYAGGVMVVGL